jgi:radical SAM superfamily enzyme YgiQ (UPF0313 family)
MAKALLINPAAAGLVATKTRKFHRRFPPLSLLITASILRLRGWEVEVNDLNANQKLTPELSQVSADSADIVIMTTNSYMDWQCPTFEVSEMLTWARRLPGDRLIITGSHGTHYPASLIRETGAAVVVREEPEWAAVEAAEAIRDATPLEDITGISYREGTEVRHNPQRKLLPMDEFPPPAYDLVNLSDYFYEVMGGNFALLEASRGCPYSCNFCNLSMFQDGYRKRSPENFLKELDDLVEQQGCRSLYIFDLEFTINRKIVKIISEHLIGKDYAGRYGFRWACQTRADSVDETLLPLMKQSGCELIHFGIEAGNPKIIEQTNKNIKKEKLLEGITATKAAGIKTAGFFIFGHPGETVENYQETLDFALELDVTYASFHPLIPFPGSPLFTEKFGESPYWDEPLPLAPSYFTAEQDENISKFIRKAYLSYYLRPRQIWKLLRQGDWLNYLKQLTLFRSFIVRS